MRNQKNMQIIIIIIKIKIKKKKMRKINSNIKIRYMKAKLDSQPFSCATYLLLVDI